MRPSMGGSDEVSDWRVHSQVSRRHGWWCGGWRVQRLLGAECGMGVRGRVGQVRIGRGMEFTCITYRAMEIRNGRQGWIPQFRW
jgi:hypothetical protein